METKIIKAVFGGGRYAVTTKRTRTDYGQVLEFVGVDLPDTFECIFSNSATSAGVGKKQIGSAQRVLIPDEYLATGQTIYAWVLVHDSEDDGRHMYNVKIPVDDMPDTSPEEPTPVEQSVISQAITALNTSVDTTTQKAQEASESADRAEQAAEGVEAYVERAESAQQAAESARDRAEEAKVSAQASAATATEKASEAISSATTASQSALTAESASESAQEYATASAVSASASAVSASQASEHASTAGSKATEASGYASNANASAQTASQKALEASQSASTAVQAKTDAESAKTASQTAQGLAESARNGAVTAKEDAESARDEAQNIANGITGKVEQIDSNTERIESLEDDRYKPYPTDIISGSIASFPDGADGIPLKSCIVQVEPVQEGSGDPSPDNVRPISGFTGVEVQRTGKNIFGGEAFRDAVLAAVSTATTGEDENGRYVTITAGSASNEKILLEYPWKENTVYTFIYRYKKNNTNGITNLSIHYKDGTYNYLSKNGGVEADTVHTEVLKSVNNKLVSDVRTIWGSGVATIYYDDFGVFEGDISVADFSPYQGQTIPITFPSEAGIVYGAHIDVINGELVVDRAQIASYNGETLPSTWISDRDVYASGTTPTIGAQVVYKLAEPITYQLTPQEITSLLGQNNIWADCGNTEVEYRADTKLYISRLTEPDADMVADANIVSGQYFMVGNNLYRATANIASGAQVIEGTNATKVSLAHALNAINA